MSVRDRRLLVRGGVFFWRSRMKLTSNHVSWIFLQQGFIRSESTTLGEGRSEPCRDWNLTRYTISASSYDKGSLGAGLLISKVGGFPGGGSGLVTDPVCASRSRISPGSWNGAVGVGPVPGAMVAGGVPGATVTFMWSGFDSTGTWTRPLVRNRSDIGWSAL